MDVGWLEVGVEVDLGFLFVYFEIGIGFCVFKFFLSWFLILYVLGCE